MAYESDPITSKLNELVASQELYFGLSDFDNLNPGERALAGTWELANEVYNGGFLQYFHNGSGEHAASMVGVLRSIEAPVAAGILEQAMELAGPGTRWGDERNYLKVVREMPTDIQDRLSELARAFFDQSDDLHLQLFRYLAKHRQNIEAPDDFWTEASVQ